MDITVEKIRELTNSVVEIDDLLSKCGPSWRVIMANVRRGYNSASLVISTPEDLDFIDELKKMGFKVKIEDTRFYKEAWIKW